MIDFSDAKYLKLAAVSNELGSAKVSGILIHGEEVKETFQTVRDMVVFTNRRIIAINVQGATGKKMDYTSLPYANIQAFSVETAGTFDLDSELELWFSGLGKVRFEFNGNIDITQICQNISERML